MRKTFLFFFLILATAIQASTIYVKPASAGGNDDTGDGTSWATAYATPTKAFGVVTTSGDIIAIMQGTYNITGAFPDISIANVQIQGGYTGSGTDRVINPSNTVLEYAGSSAVRVLNIFGTGLTFSGITFQNLQPATSQYGIFVQITSSTGTNLTLEDCVVKNFINLAGTYIRGIFRFNVTATLNINRCQFINCQEKSTAANNAVITRNGGNATVNIKNSIIQGTSTKPFISGGAGGTNTYTISNCTFINNTAGAVTSSTSATTISNSILYNSTLTGSGTLNYSYYKGSIGTYTASNSTSFTNASDVFADETNYYPATTFAGIDAGNNTAASGTEDIVKNTRITNSTVDIGAYENISAPVGTAGSNVVSVGTAAASYYPYGAVVQIPVTVASGCSPDPINDVVFTGTSPNYTANITVYTPRTINFTATAANYEVTVNTTNVTVTSPTLIDGKYSSSSSSIIYFTINAGTENPVATMNANPVTPVLISGNDYLLTLTGISGSTNVVISASVKNFDVTLSKNAYVASVSGLSEGTQQKEYGYSDLTFTLATGAHSPYVTVNGVVVATAENGGVYSLPGFKITGVTNIVISAFAENVLPVNEDTYQRRNGEISGYYASQVTMQSRGETAGYAAIPLLKFIPTEAIKTGGYQKVQLRLVPTTTHSRTYSYTVRQFPIADFASILVVGTDDYEKIQTATAVGTEAQTVANVQQNVPILLDVTDTYILDFASGEILLSVVKSSESTIDYLHSLENGNPDYVPQLVFSEKISTDVTSPSYNSNDNVKYYNLQGIEVSKPIKGNVYIVKQATKVKKVLFVK